MLSFESLSTFTRISVHAIQTRAAMLTRVAMAMIDHLTARRTLETFVALTLEVIAQIHTPSVSVTGVRLTARFF